MKEISAQVKEFAFRSWPTFEFANLKSKSICKYHFSYKNKLNIQKPPKIFIENFKQIEFLFQFI